MERRTINTMTKKKGKERQTTQITKEKGQKDKQHNGDKKRDIRTSNTMGKIKGQKNK
jgi:hypothetical protein